MIVTINTVQCIFFVLFHNMSKWPLASVQIKNFKEKILTYDIIEFSVFARLTIRMNPITSLFNISRWRFLDYKLLEKWKIIELKIHFTISNLSKPRRFLLNRCEMLFIFEQKLLYVQHDSKIVLHLKFSIKRLMNIWSVSSWFVIEVVSSLTKFDRFDYFWMTVIFCTLLLILLVYNPWKRVCWAKKTWNRECPHNWYGFENFFAGFLL